MLADTTPAAPAPPAVAADTAVQPDNLPQLKNIIAEHGADVFARMVSDRDRRTAGDARFNAAETMMNTLARDPEAMAGFLEHVLLSPTLGIDVSTAVFGAAGEQLAFRFQRDEWGDEPVQTRLEQMMAHAARSDNVRAVSALVAAGAPVDLDAEGLNPLHHAVIGGSSNAVRELLEYLEPLEPTRDGRTLMQLALSAGHFHLIDQQLPLKLLPGTSPQAVPVAGRDFNLSPR